MSMKSGLQTSVTISAPPAMTVAPASSSWTPRLPHAVSVDARNVHAGREVDKLGFMELGSGIGQYGRGSRELDKIPRRVGVRGVEGTGQGIEVAPAGDERRSLLFDRVEEVLEF